MRLNISWYNSRGRRMKHFQFLTLCLCPLFLLGCSANKEDEEVNIDQMVLNEEEEVEWTSQDRDEGKKIAADLDPMPQEMILSETPEGQSSLDSQVR